MKTIETENLMSGLLKQMNRAREIKKMYDEIPMGIFGSALIQAEINQAEEAIASGDVVKMVRSFQALKEIK